MCNKTTVPQIPNLFLNLSISALLGFLWHMCLISYVEHGEDRISKPIVKVRGKQKEIINNNYTRAGFVVAVVTFYYYYYIYVHVYVYELDTKR